MNDTLSFLLVFLLCLALGSFTGLVRWFAEWIDPATLPMEWSRHPAHEKRFKELVERNPRFSDPIYRKNVQRLIERNRKFEDAKE
jgi:hypothetical protein